MPTITIHVTFSPVAVWLPFIGLFSPWLFPVVIEFTSQDMTCSALPPPSFPTQSLALCSRAISPACSNCCLIPPRLVYVTEKKIDQSWLEGVNTEQSVPD